MTRTCDDRELTSQRLNNRPPILHVIFSWLRSLQVFLSGTKNEHKPKLLSPEICQWGRGLPRARVGAKKFEMSLETRESNFLGGDIPGFCWDIPELEKFEKKVCVQFLAPILRSL